MRPPKNSTLHSFKQAGFSLIELVVVIVILGLIAVTAAPRFLNLSTDAKLEALEAIGASLRSAADLAKNKAVINGVENASRSSPDNPPAVDIDLGTLELKFGYPEAYADETDGLDILDLISLSGDIEVCYSSTCTTGNSSRVKIGYDITEGDGCYVRYVEPGGTGNPNTEIYLVDFETSQC
ncbi:type II secretion system protein [Catenovulum sp. SM1970]|uniref:prepilin-type N-terminal cleavage/methylation domain-containing protein n=1 Tax=Marinifaba aquimaris TaxID=2741323 RepID=UPI001571FD34|nr:type II secretion system protein [Marinifaba aquimaris]NTS75773.1 type II secretion system protein [Marinifaba aquimaris]